MENKIKKHKKILSELKIRRKMNDKHCELNNISSTPYMDGSNKVLDDMIDYIQKLK